MAKKTDPFASLGKGRRCITPKILQGEKKKLWNAFLVKYLKGEFAGVPVRCLLDWGREHLGLNCSPSCFRATLIEAKEDADV